MTTFYNTKSSCVCSSCNEVKFNSDINMGNTPTNMSVSNCKFPSYFDCYSTSIFQVKDEPFVKKGNILLNPSVVSDNKFSSDFKKIDGKKCVGSSCPGTTYLNSDPRLYNAAAGVWLQLDRPPLDSTIKLNTLNSDKSLNCYGKGYKSYSDVNAGQVLYFIDKELDDAYFEPLFSKKATAVGMLYQDPMGAMKPSWSRIPKEKYDPILGSRCKVADEFCLSFMKDTQFQREDILAKQMTIRNQQRYETRWT